MVGDTPISKKSQGAAVTEVRSSSSEIDAFLSKASEIPSPTEGGGRLIFALDATMSRQPTWDQACHIQSEMFREADRISGLQIKLVYFRGFDECRASRWFRNGTELAKVMGRISCQGGRTQIGKVLSAGLKEARTGKVQALVYIGDCMEENVDNLCHKAGELGLLGVPAFCFQEGRDPAAETAFREIARLTNGAFCRFDNGSARQLADLLKAVATYAAGGRKALQALEKSGGKGARLLLQQLR